jgi:hypothetical protein
MKRAFPFVMLLAAAVLGTAAAAQEAPPSKASNKAGSKPMSQKAGPGDKQAMIREALSAAPRAIAKTATVKDWDGNVLKQGSGAYTCYPTPPMQEKIGKEPMCLDQVWQAWGEAWMNKKDFKADKVGVAYMLEGDTGASNTDPYATAPTKDNQWVVSGPHTMVVLPNPADLDSISTDPNNGGPFVMWKGTPYAHIMVPVGKSPAMAPAKK